MMPPTGPLRGSPQNPRDTKREQRLKKERAGVLIIHWLIDDKLAFLSFYYLPIIVAGFYLGRVTAVLSAILVVSLVLFFQAVQGLGIASGLRADILLTLIPWGGFLILTGWVIGL